MAKRLTDTTIWKKQRWFRKLSPIHKLAWKYITDTCDHSGILKIDFSEFTDDLGVEEFNISEFINSCNVDFDKKNGVKIKRERIKLVDENTVWITGFIKFQYEGKDLNVNPSIPAIYSALTVLNSYGTLNEGLSKGYFTLSKPYTKGMLRTKDKDKDKEKDKEYKNISTENELTFKLSSLGEIKVLVLQCEDWAFKELKDFVQKSQQNFESVAMTNPLMNNAENFKIVIQQFVNMIQSTDDYQESSKLRKFFGNWVSKKNGSLQNFIDGYKNNLGGKKNKNSYI